MIIVIKRISEVVIIAKVVVIGGMERRFKQASEARLLKRVSLLSFLKLNHT